MYFIFASLLLVINKIRGLNRGGKQMINFLFFKMEFNNAVRENNQHSLRHGSKKANMEKNQNPRIIPCKFLTADMPF